MESVWTVAREKLTGHVTESNFKIWIDPLQPLRVEGGRLILGCPNRFFMAWIKENYLKQITEVIRDGQNGGFPIEGVELAIAPATAPSQKPAVHRQQELPRLEVHQKAPLRFNPRYTFDRFIVGANNEYAYSATKAIANGRDLNTDSLFLLSEPGLGKSHLSHALGHYILGLDQRKNVYYLTAEDFTNELVYSLKNKCVEDFKNKYRRNCDVLVLEEIHFLSGKEKVQAELSYTLDCLIENNKKVIFTSSKRPKNIPKLGRQFSSRLSNSLISAIDSPDYNTRFRILQQKARDNNLKAPDSVLDFLAKRITKDVRKMESCLNSLSAKCMLLNRSLDLALARETLGDLMEVEPSSCDIETIQEQVCRYYQVSLDDLRSRSRRKAIVHPRNVAIYLTRKFTDLSLESIGKLFDRNHSTVLYSLNTTETKIKRDTTLKNQIEFLSGRIGSEN